MKMYKIPVFNIFRELEKIGKSRLEHSKIPIFDIFENTEKFGSAA